MTPLTNEELDHWTIHAQLGEHMPGPVALRLIEELRLHRTFSALPPETDGGKWTIKKTDANAWEIYDAAGELHFKGKDDIQIVLAHFAFALQEAQRLRARVAELESPPANDPLWTIKTLSSEIERLRGVQNGLIEKVAMLERQPSRRKMEALSGAARNIIRLFNHESPISVECQKALALPDDDPPLTQGQTLAEGQKWSLVDDIARIIKSGQPYYQIVEQVIVPLLAGKWPFSEPAPAVDSQPARSILELPLGSKIRFHAIPPVESFGGCESGDESMMGKIYTLAKREIHSWHTKIWVEEIPGRVFNSVCFEDAGVAAESPKPKRKVEFKFDERSAVEGEWVYECKVCGIHYPQFDTDDLAEIEHGEGCNRGIESVRKEDCYIKPKESKP